MGVAQAGDHVNIVWMPYCDGGTYGGRRVDPATKKERESTTTIYMRGAHNVEAVINHLISTANLAQVMRVGGFGARM